MQISDLAAWVRDLDEPSVGPGARGPPAEPGLVRGDRPRLSQPGPAVGHAVGRRVAADEDGPPPELAADRHDLRVRRADHRAACPRRRETNHLLLRPPRQGQHGPRRRARPGGDPDRRPRRRHGPRRGSRTAGRSCTRARPTASRRPGRRPAGTWTSGSPSSPSRARPAARSRSGTPGSTTSGRLGGRAAGRARRGDGRRGLRQELADPRLPAPDGPVGDRDRPVRDPGLPAIQPGDLHRASSTRSAPPSRRRTASSPPCSARTPRARARAATGSARPTRASGSWPRS